MLNFKFKYFNKFLRKKIKSNLNLLYFDLGKFTFIYKFVYQPSPFEIDSYNEYVDLILEIKVLHVISSSKIISKDSEDLSFLH